MIFPFLQQAFIWPLMLMVVSSNFVTIVPMMSDSVLSSLNLCLYLSIQIIISEIQSDIVVAKEGKFSKVNEPQI